jgi:hypothetical protein
MSDVQLNSLAALPVTLERDLGIFPMGRTLLSLL